MGTLFNQPPRQEVVKDADIELTFEYIVMTSKQFNISYRDAIELIRLNDETTMMKHKIHDMDVRDEQFTGLGDLLKEINESLSYLNEMIGDMPQPGQ